MRYLTAIYLQLALVLCLSLCSTIAEKPVWRWTCEDGSCIKKRLLPKDMATALDLEGCKMFCDSFGTLWPRPTGSLVLGNHLAKIDLTKIHFNIRNSGYSDELLEAAIQRIKYIIGHTVPENRSIIPGGKTLNVELLNEQPDIKGLTLETDESYTLKSEIKLKEVVVTIKAKNFFGLRHGMETLSQLFVYDGIRNEVQFVRDAEVSDKPEYPYRGFLLDTARNYFPIETIKKTIDGMAMVKLNSFHWHITDTHSFPFVSQRRPELSKLGAYSPEKVYTKEAIRELVKYATVRGVRVIPEFDAPAHVGEGWQDTNLTVCFNEMPWRSYCVEPPCGQLDPTKPEVYDVLEDIYKDMAEAFSTDIFHMGGDEVLFPCWEKTASIKEFMARNSWSLNKEGWLTLWEYFQHIAQQRVYKAFKGNLPIVMWTSGLTESPKVVRHLPPEDYIIQVWTKNDSPQIKDLLTKGYNLILSNYDALYFDCGGGAWIGTGSNWCSPYIGWQEVYENSPKNIATTAFKNQIYGTEAAVWSEQIDGETLDGRVWPRLAAMAERVWAEPNSTWIDASSRFLFFRDRLAKMGFKPESLQPEWCMKNGGYCT